MGNMQYEEEILQRYATWLRLERGNSESSIRDSLNKTKQFIAWLEKNGYFIQDIEQDIINNYLSYCYEKYALNSLVAITINLRKFCYHFLKKDVKIKVTTAKSPNRDKTALTKEEVKAMFDIIKGKPLETAILKVLYYTGMRASELRNLDIEDVDFNRLQIRIKHGKGNQTRVVNITKDCAMAIQRWLEVRPKAAPECKNALFILSHGKRFSSFYLWSLVKRVAAKAGITKNVYPHKFRITMITLMAEHGCTPNEIQAQSGHRDLSTLLGYIQHTNQRIRRMYDRVFGDIETLSKQETKTLSIDRDPDYYKKLAFEKYLQGEINSQELSSLLNLIDKQEQEKKELSDIAYI
ncbi:MAG TPA: hypothetical protein ENI33_07490 [Thermoplasmatales archaeon]|nr:hypothetical protein [Thermoplasmatales archaeon]